MGVYIKGMEMPTSCYKCDMRRRDGMDIVCPIAHEMFSVADVNILEYRLKNCPLVPVPLHGRLVDLNAQDTQIETLIEKHLHGYTKSTWDFVCELRDILKRSPTVIPAEEGE